MSLRNQQTEFAKDVILLLQFCFDNGIEITIGEVERKKQQQQYYLDTGKSKTMNSYHLKKLAIDLNFFIKSELTYDILDLKIVGNYWESLNPLNKAGMFFSSFKDVPHFERRV